MAKDCPWSHYDPATISFCEERLCAWIAEPSNTWSNLAYIGVGIYILYLCRSQLTNILSSVGLTAILVGIGSFAFHATGTWWGEFLDVSAMFLISGQFITFAVKRQFKWGNGALFVLYFLVTGLSMLLLWNIRKIGIPLFALHVTIAGTLEFWMFFKRQVPTNYSYMLKLIAAFVVAFTAWNLDISGILCDPTNHFITGHAVWHVSNSLCLYFFYKFNLQFEEAAT